MSAWNSEANEIFADAIGIRNQKARREFVADRCRDDEALREQVEALLNVGTPKDDYLSRSIDYDEMTMDLANVRVSPGTVIGNYKLLEQIGEGGFGVVYMAEQKEPVRRKVALKIIKAGMDTKEVIARFEAERQALAMMEHPNIAKVLDAGATQSGRPYFVMELVRGVPITQFCDENRLPTNERLRLFMSVCHAIQHAHQKAVIHRDIKPSNVLVTMHDDTPVPKVIDFGIAKCTQSELTQKTVFTQFRQLMGTPSYMAPEQAQMSGLDIDTRCDIYALGVLLYELLTGATPFDAKELMKGGLDEICRRLREEEPPKPSSRVTTMDAKSRSSLADSLKISPDKLGSILRGDLDWIVMKALEKNRTRRYETANGFSTDVQRYLNCEPVSAVAPSVSYRIRKFTQRNKTTVSMAALLIIALVMGAGAATWQAYRADRERSRAEAAEELAQTRAEVARTNARRADAEAKRATGSEAEMRRRLYISDMRAAQLAWQEANVGRVQAILERHIPKEGELDLRGFEWYYFWKLCLLRQRAKTIDLDGRPNTVAFSPDGRSVLVASWNGLASLLPADDLTNPSKEFACSREAVPFAVFSNDGRHVAVPQNEGEDHYVSVIDMEQYETVCRLDQSNPTLNAAFSPDGHRIATINAGGWVEIWNLLGDRLALLPRSDPKYKRAGLAFSPDGSLLAAACSQDIWIWSVAENQLVKKLPIGYLVKGLTFTDATEGKLLAGSNRGHLLVFDTRDWSELVRSKPHDDDIRCIAVSPDGRVFATSSRDNSIKLWDTSTRREISTLKGHSGIVDSVSFSPDGKTLASVSQDYSIALWEVAEALGDQTITGSNENKRFIKVDQRLFSVDVAARTRGLTSISNVDAEFDRLAMSSRGLLAVVMRDAIEFRHQHIRRRIARPRPGLKIRQTRFSPDGEFFVLSLSDGSLHWWNVEDLNALAAPVSVQANARQSRSLAVDPTNSFVAMGFRDGTITVWNLKSGTIYRDNWPAHKEHAESLRFHPNTFGLLFSGSMDTSIKAWHLDEPKPRLVLKDHTAMVNALLFSSDGKTLFSAGGEPTIRVWDTEHWEVRCVLPAPFSTVELEMLDQRTLLAGAGSIFVWRGATDEEITSH